MGDTVSPAGGTRDEHRGESKSAESVLASRLTWLMLFRSVVVMTVLLGAVAQRAGNEDALFARDAVEVYIACGLSFVVVLVGSLWLRYQGNRGILALTHLQLLWDALFATVLCHATGGLTSALSFLYFLTVLAAAALVSRRQVLLVTVECVALFSVLLLAEFLGLGKTSLAEAGPPYLTNVLGLSLVAVLAGYLTDQLRSASENLRSTEADLVLLEELHAAVLSSLPSGVLTVDSGRRVLYVNEAGAAILGQSPEELVGRSANEVIGQPLHQLLQGISTPTRRFELDVTLGRQERVLGGSVASLHGVRGLVGEVVVFQDLTELRHLERELDRSVRFASMGRMSARLAHEIRNPLAAMIGCLELMEQDAQRSTPTPADETVRMVGIVSREARRLSNLVTAF
ncbi:MAG: histidine kinase dimerization/phospho-acceptor domain-containing protein, partial [Myxococcota bacterium]